MHTAHRTPDYSTHALDFSSPIPQLSHKSKTSAPGQGEAGISQFELADLCFACTRCGWDCAASSVGASGGDADSGIGLSVHVGVGCGRVRCFHVGSDRLGWQLVVSGELFENQVPLLPPLLSTRSLAPLLSWLAASPLPTPTTPP